jgi:dihydroneopterin aldolase
MDTISIHELRVETLIGIYEWERRTPQTLLLDVEFAIPGRQCRAQRPHPRHDRLC